MAIYDNIVRPKHSSSWTTPAGCKAYYGVPYQFREIQIHWWGDPATKPTHDGIVSYIANKTGGSVNYVASGSKITLMVDEANCAFTTQNGNPYGIKIECSPYGTDADYKNIGKLVADIRKRRGNIPLVPHKKYWNTACPGTLSLQRIDEEANKILKGADEMKVNRDETILLLKLLLHDKPSQEQVNSTVGSDLEPLLKKWVANRYYKSIDKKIADYDKLADENAKLRAELAGGEQAVKDSLFVKIKALFGK